jgi:hypothetical protein
MSDTDYDDYDDGECWQCGGEGRVAGNCIDYCCVEQDDPYCEYCSRVCDVCHPPTAKQIEEGNKLREILKESLADVSRSVTTERNDG